MDTEPIAIQITADSAAKVYDGAELTKNSYQLTSGTLATGNTIDSVKDDLTGDRWPVASLAPGESGEFTAAYTVQEKDVLAGRVKNVATAKGTSPDPDQPDVPVTPGEKEEETERSQYTLTVNYKFADGREAAPSYNATYNQGDTYNVASPAVDGYAPDRARVSGTIERNTVIDVVIAKSAIN